MFCKSASPALWGDELLIRKEQQSSIMWLYTKLLPPAKLIDPSKGEQESAGTALTLTIQAVKHAVLRATE